MNKLRFHFVFYVFNIMLATSIIISAVTFMLIHLGILTFNGTKPFIPIIMLFLTSIIIGTTISTILGHKVVLPINELSKATQSVAKGNFKIQLDETHNVDVIRNMFINFNTMTKELGSIETFRNDFIVNVSHEFKTPIAAIEGYATLLQDRNLTEGESAEYTKIIIESARQLSILSDNILKISKLENQEIIAEKSNFQLDEQIRMALLMLETKWNEKNIDLDLELDSVVFFGNPELLIQAWLNLFGNAIKFTKNNGTVTCKLKKTDNMITIVISDNGIGMTNEIQKHIFEKFYQGDRTRYSEGYGLGLTLTKRIIDLSGGEISVDSEPEQGTTFTVKLPV